MAWRKRHGNARNHGVGPMIEVLPPDEQPPVTPGPPAPVERDASGRFVRGNGAGRKKRVRPGPHALAGLPVSDKFAPFQRWGVRWSAHRAAEMTRIHGELSVGVTTLLQSAGQQLASSRFLQALGGANPVQKGAKAQWFMLASRLADSARQNELAAYELAVREAAARRTGPSTANALPPWLMVVDGEDTANDDDTKTEETNDAQEQED